jgi:hypothetical protein
MFFAPVDFLVGINTGWLLGGWQFLIVLEKALEPVLWNS